MPDQAAKDHLWNRCLDAEGKLLPNNFTIAVQVKDIIAALDDDDVELSEPLIFVARRLYRKALAIPTSRCDSGYADDTLLMKVIIEALEYQI